MSASCSTTSASELRRINADASPAGGSALLLSLLTPVPYSAAHTSALSYTRHHLAYPIYPVYNLYPYPPQDGRRMGQAEHHLLWRLPMHTLHQLQLRCSPPRLVSSLLLSPPLASSPPPLLASSPPPLLSQRQDRVAAHGGRPSTADARRGPPPATRGTHQALPTSHTHRPAH